MTWSSDQHLIVFLEDVLLDNKKNLARGAEKLLFNLSDLEINNRYLVSNLGVEEINELSKKLGLRVFFEQIISCKQFGLDAKDARFWQKFGKKQHLSLKSSAILVNNVNIVDAALEAGVGAVYSTKLEATDKIEHINNLENLMDILSSSEELVI